MSELTSLPSAQQAQALEYVLGTLRGAQRRAFDKAMKRDVALQTMVAAWEETLMALPGPTPQPAPAATWANIEAALAAQSAGRPTVKSTAWGRYAPWGAGIAAACLLSLGVWFASGKLAPPAPPAWKASYVAVLTDEAGHAHLTALTQSQGEPPNAKHQLRLQGAPILARQVWAVAEKDGRAQKLFILEGNTAEPRELSKAQWAMIKEAKELLLTEETDDDQPGQVLARGPCVRLAQQSVPKPTI